MRILPPRVDSISIRHSSHVAGGGAMSSTKTGLDLSGRRLATSPPVASSIPCSPAVAPARPHRHHARVPAPPRHPKSTPAALPASVAYGDTPPIRAATAQLAPLIDPVPFSVHFQSPPSDSLNLSTRPLPRHARLPEGHRALRERQRGWGSGLLEAQRGKASRQDWRRGNW